MKKKVVLIGASTGGPGHLKKLLKDLPSNIKVPIVVAQHMSSVFIPSFVQQFKTELKSPVLRLHEDRQIEQGGVYICEKNCVFSNKRGIHVSFSLAPAQTLYNPSIDALFASATCLCDDYEVLSIILTGIGHDGASGMVDLQRNGARCIAESEESAVVFGMPKKAQEIVPNVKVLSLDRIKRELEEFVNVFF